MDSSTTFMHVIVFLALALVCAVTAGRLRRSNSPLASRFLRFFATLAATSLLVAGFHIGGCERTGKVLDEPTEFSMQLRSGHSYEVRGVDMVGKNDYLILIKDIGASDYRTIRVKQVPPHLFTIVDDRPVAIDPN